MPFYFFFGLLGMVIGGVLTWFLVVEHPFENLETPGGPVDPVEADLLAKQMTEAGIAMDEQTVTRVLEFHGAYVVGKFREEQAKAEEAKTPVAQVK